MLAETNPWAMKIGNEWIYEDVSTEGIITAETAFEAQFAMNPQGQWSLLNSRITQPAEGGEIHVNRSDAQAPANATLVVDNSSAHSKLLVVDGYNPETGEYAHEYGFYGLLFPPEGKVVDNWYQVAQGRLVPIVSGESSYPPPHYPFTFTVQYKQAPVQYQVYGLSGTSDYNG